MFLSLTWTFPQILTKAEFPLLLWMWHKPPSFAKLLQMQLPKWAVANNLVGRTRSFKMFKRTQKNGTHHCHIVPIYTLKMHKCLFVCAVMPPGRKHNVFLNLIRLTLVCRVFFDRTTTKGFAQKFAFSSLSFSLFIVIVCFSFAFFCFYFWHLLLHETHPPTLFASLLVNLEYNELSQWLWCKKLPHCLYISLCLCC